MDEFKSNNGVKIIQGDALNPADVKKTIEGQEMVVVALGGRPNARQVCSQAQPLINKAVKENNVKRMVVVTSMGCNESYEDGGLVIRLLVNTILRSAISDKNIQEDSIRADFKGKSADHSETRWFIERRSDR